MYRRLMLRPPSIAAAGIVASSSARPMLLTIMVLFLRFLSTHTPTNSPKRGKARRERAPRIPICDGSAPSAVTATQGIANAENWLPKKEIESADQNLRKSECLKSDSSSPRPPPGPPDTSVFAPRSLISLFSLHDVPSVSPVANESNDPPFLLQPVKREFHAQRPRLRLPLQKFAEGQSLRLENPEYPLIELAVGQTFFSSQRRR